MPESSNFFVLGFQWRWKLLGKQGDLRNIYIYNILSLDKGIKNIILFLMELDAFVSDLFEERMHFYKCVFSTWSQNQSLWKYHANFGGLELLKYDVRYDHTYSSVK